MRNATSQRNPARDRGEATILTACLFTVKSQRFQGRPIRDGKENGVLVRGVLMAVPVPGGDRENVFSLPRKCLFFHSGEAPAPEDLVDHRARVAMRAQLFMGPEQL